MEGDGAAVDPCRCLRLPVVGHGTHAPGWSRDGTRIAFASGRDGVTAIWVMNADGTGLSNLSGAMGYDFLPSWSP